MNLRAFVTGLAGILPFAVVFWCADAARAQANILWEAYNDYRPSDQTHPNATGYDLRVTDDGGVLRNFATGADLAASVRVVVEGDASPDDFGANSPVNPGSPADELFGGIVDIGNDGLPGLRAASNIKLILLFEGLDPTKRYNFRGTVSRGGNYNDRWSVFAISGTEAHVAAHVDGSANQNLLTRDTYPAADLGPDQVALNSGDNKAGSLIGWDNIEPGPDGVFAIEAQQYVGPAPFGNPAAAPYGYGCNAIYLAQVQSTGELRITENPAVSQIVPAGRTAELRVEASSPQAIAYQWQKAPPGSETFEDVGGATEAVYTTPPLAVADHGSTYRCRVASGGFELLSGEAVVEVDGDIPVVTRVEPSINFNAVYLTFSEPMKLALLADPANYAISGGLEVQSAVARDPVTVRLLTGLQPKGAAYELTVRNLEDLAGNLVDAGASVPFTAYTYATEAAGLEIWENIGGGAVADLRNHPRFPGQPDVDYSAGAMDSTLVFPDGPNNTYGGRFRAWLLPPETGEYHFFLRADDNGEFRISSGAGFGELEDPDRLPDAAAGGNAVFQEPGVDTSTSEPVYLEAGKKYAVEVLWKESNGGDRAQLAWRKVGDDTAADLLEPIPSVHFCYFGSNASDADGDGMSDAYELLSGLNVGENDAGEDLDNDGLTNKEEYDLGTAANLEDTDGDSLKDGAETGTGVWVDAGDTGSSPLRPDTDGDTLDDGSEVRGGTDPNRRDTDADGFDDNVELALNTDPASAASKPTSIVAVADGEWDDAQTWSDGMGPRGSERYVAVGGVTSRLETDAGPFGGRSLTLVGPGVSLVVEQDGATTVDLTLRNAGLQATASTTLGGKLRLDGRPSIDVDDNDFVVEAPWTGAPLLTVRGASLEAEIITGSVELTSTASDFAGQITVTGTHLIGRAEGSLGRGLIRLVGGALTFGYDYDHPEGLLQIEGGNFGLTLDGDVTVADLVGIDPATGSVLFSLHELAGPGPYTADDLLAVFQLDQGIAGEGLLHLEGNTGDTDVDGLPDAWETEHFGGLDAGPGDDPDEDGRINLAERAGETDPNVWDPPEMLVDPETPEAPGILSIIKDASGVTLEFFPGIPFDVEYSQGMQGWEPIANGVLNTYKDTDAGRTARPAGYYRGVTR